MAQFGRKWWTLCVVSVTITNRDALSFGVGATLPSQVQSGIKPPCTLSKDKSIHTIQFGQMYGSLSAKYYVRYFRSRKSATEGFIKLGRGFSGVSSYPHEKSPSYGHNLPEILSEIMLSLALSGHSSDLIHSLLYSYRTIFFCNQISLGFSCSSG
jgi:hypothetical protein